MSDLNKNKVLVTGANGLLGQKLAERLLQMPNVEVCLTGKGACRLHKAKDKYQILDVVDNHEVDLLFSQFLPDVVIHAAAMTQVDDCEIDKELCYVQNVTAVENLIRACNRYNTHLIYLSTDFVFDGISGPYKEDDVPNPISYYGYCKLEAEKKVQQMMSTWSIVRTILVFGVLKDLSRNNIVLWVKNNLEKGQSIKVVTDQFRTPTLAEDLADGCIRIALSGHQGIFHIAGNELMSIYDLSCKVAEFFGLDKELIIPVDSVTINQPAKRPPRTGLLINKAQNVLGYHPHSFTESLTLIQAQLTNC